MNRVKVITPPVSDPVTLSEVKEQCAVSHDDDDALLQAYIQAATKYCERFMGRALVERTLDFYLDAFPADGKPIELPFPPLIGVTGVFYTDSAGVEQEFTDFETDDASEPARLYLAPANSWPSPRVSANAVRVRYSAGHVQTTAPASGEVPGDIIAAILLYIATLYENRETVVIGQTATMLPWSAEQLLRPNSVEKSMA